MFPHTKKEEELQKNSYRYIAGIDEAGRGALAGPVVAVAVIMPKDTYDSKIRAEKHLEGVKDSKLLSPKKRDELYDRILKNCLGYGVGVVEPCIIDDINIFEATKLAMKEAVGDLEKIIPDYLLIDAMEIESDVPQKSVIKGDMKCYSIACASIMAKVVRDRMMVDFHQKFPNYSFDKHKGYGTKLHLECLEKYGPCEIHRFSYKPVRKSKTSKDK